MYMFFEPLLTGFTNACMIKVRATSIRVHSYVRCLACYISGSGYNILCADPFSNFIVDITTALPVSISTSLHSSFASFHPR